MIVLLSSIAFAVVGITLNINGTGSFSSSKWDIYFNNLSVANTIGRAEEIKKPSIINKTTIDNIEVSLSEPGDMIRYDVELVNEGNIDAKIDEIIIPTLSDKQSRYLEVELLYDDGSSAKKDDILQRMTLKKMTLKIKFRDDITKEDLPTESEVIDISCKITFVQTNNTDISQDSTIIEPEQHASDTNPGDITNGGLYDGSISNPYQVESIEDLVQFSNDVSNGNNYSKKYISLSQDLDFSASGSYADSKTMAYGDINGDGTISSLKEELTSSLGFKPIGDNTNYFSGTFNGNGHTISNLSINRNSENYVGLFGRISGTINNLNIEDFDITGNNYVGAVSGYGGTINNLKATSTVSGTDYVGGVSGGYGTIKHSTIDSNVSGNNYVGGVLGGNTGKVYSTNIFTKVIGNERVGGAMGSLGSDGAGQISGVIVKGDVEGRNLVGGIIGSSGSFIKINAIYKEGNVKGNSNTGLIVGKISLSNINSYSVKTTTLNSSTIESKDQSSLNGQTIDSVDDIYKDINTAELVFDTYIGGDNDGDGYYLDYNEDKTKLIEKSVNENPLTFSLSGSGTSGSPYIINTIEELKQVNLKLDKYYKLNNDIDLQNESKYYVIGSYSNVFKGTFDGKGHTISNLVINDANLNYGGLFGKVSGTINNLNIKDFDITGNNYVGAVSGYGGTINNLKATSTVSGTDYVGGVSGGYGTIKHSTIDSNVSGNNYVGGVLGGNTGKVYSTNIFTKVIGNERVGGAMGSLGSDGAGQISGVIVKGDVEGRNLVGGIIGSSGSFIKINAIYKEGNVKGNSNTGLIVGKISLSNINSYSVKTTTLNSSTIESKDQSSLNGQTIDSVDDIYKDINTAELVFDTYIGGDNDGDGYYLDYNEDKTKLIEKSVNENPLTFSLSGSGTSGSPYIINTIEELKQVNLKLDKYYKLNNDIDLQNESKYYVIGSYSNVFKGTFDGKGHTISNLVINDANLNYGGLFGKVSGTINNLNIKDFDITGNNYVGAVSGYGTKINNIKVSSNIAGNNYVGGISGYISNINQFIVNADVSGNSYVGCASGRSDGSKGVCLSGKITGKSNANRIFGSSSSSTKNVIAVMDNVLVNNSKRTNTNSNSNDGADISTSDLIQSKYEELGFSFDESTTTPYWIYNDGNVVLKGIN